MAFNVLIVDDSAVMRHMIIRTLAMARLPIGTVHQAGDGEQGLALLDREWVDLLLLDINMPVMNGEEMLRRVRASADTASLPVIVVSTEGSETRLAALIAMGAAIVRKPFAPETLRDAIIRITGVTDDEYYHAVPVAHHSCDF